MGFYRLVSVFLLLSIAAVSIVYSGIINNKIREKRSYIGNCQEEVISIEPCKKVTCPDGPDGAPLYIYHECQITPNCPMYHDDTSATCCRIKCVCGDGNKIYLPGESFEVSPEPGKHWNCTCGDNAVPDCEEFLKIPPKQPTRPPPTFPPFPGFPPNRDEEQN